MCLIGYPPRCSCMGESIGDVFITMMRYSEIPRDFSTDSVRFVDYDEEYVYENLRDESPPSDVSAHSGPLIRNTSSPTASAAINKKRKDARKLSLSNNGENPNCLTSESSIKSNTNCSKTVGRKNSVGSASVKISTLSNAGCYFNYGSTPPGKTQSLPPNASIKDYDSVILSALRVSPEELANQITLLDFPIFEAILPDELTSCAWTKKDKHVTTPNIVAFTRRFNHTSFWTVQEILGGETPKQRAEIVTHFIKVAKKLFDLNNLHSLFAVVSGMQSASIFRLKKTWALISKKDKLAFDRLADVFTDRNNWENLREYLESLRLPCIPYLGLFLTDLVYIDLAHPHFGGLESEQRKNKMNNILRVISNYQQSDYSYIQAIAKTKNYLQSIRYIEELQNIFEEDQYKKSLKLEPSSSVPSSSSCSSKESFNFEIGLACLNLSPAKTLGSMRVSAPPGSKFVPTHRKCRSLGSNIFGKANTQQPIHPQDTTESAASQPRHLLDDSVLEDNHNIHAIDAISTESSEGAVGPIDSDRDILIDSQSFQGCVRRKTVLRDGRKPAVASWQRYWLQIWANSLVYFPPKSFKGTDRNDFKREPCKVCPLDGWSAQRLENPKHKNSFELFNPASGTVYKFRTDCPKMAILWMEAIRRAAQRTIEKPVPINLMSFE